MKELKVNDDRPLITTHYPINQRLPTKRWVIAQARPEKLTVMQNECTEVAYHRVLNLVKRLYLKPNETFYERDLKQDRSKGSLSMHSFISRNFYWKLYCEFTYAYAIEFAFYDCDYEAELRIMLKAFPLDRQAKEKELMPNFNTFYHTVLKIQEPVYLHSL
jgi:hypothetical protein